MLNQLVMASVWVGGISAGMGVCLTALPRIRQWWLQDRRSNARQTLSLAASGESECLQRACSQRPVRWRHPFLRRVTLIGGPILVYGLYASFACAQGTLHHIDPVIFMALQMMVLLPVTVVLLFCARCSPHSTSTLPIVRQGVVCGGILGVGFLCMAISLRNLGIIPSAMLTALDGIAASGISWMVLRQRPSVSTCMAAACAGTGALLLWSIAPGRWQSDLLALFCGLLFTVAALYVEQSPVTRGSIKQLWPPFFGGMFSAMAAVTLALALCFGVWSSLQTFTSTDLAILLYTSLATVLLPILLVTALQRYLSAVTVAFCAVLEPLSSIGFAFVLGNNPLALPGWCGCGLILLSVLVQARVGAVSRTQAGDQEQTGVHEDGAVEGEKG